MSDMLIVVLVLLALGVPVIAHLFYIVVLLVHIRFALSEMGRDLAQISADSNEQTERMRKLFKTTEQLIVVKRSNPFAKN